MTIKNEKKTRTHEIDHLKKEVEDLTAALAAVKSRKDAYFLEIRIDDGENFSITRNYYWTKRDAVNDLHVAKAKFAEGNKELESVDPRQVSKGSMDLTIAREDGNVFRGTITRIKII